MPDLPKVEQDFEANATDYVAGIEAMIAANERLLKSLDDVLAKVEEVQAAIDHLDGKTIVITVKYVEQGKPDVIQHAVTVTQNVGGGGDGGGAALAASANAAAAALSREGDAANSTARDVAGLAAATGGAAAANTIWAGGWLGLNRNISLWAGLMPGVLGHIKLWHVLLDGAVEATVALAAASIALGAGLAAIYPTAEHIFDRLNAMHTVSTALNQSIGPLTGKFAQLQNALAPQVVEMYGGALNAVNTAMRGTSGPIQSIVTMFDDWIAKIDIYMARQGGMNSLLRTGQGFLQQFASFIGEVGIAINNLIKADPGTAHFLMDLIDGFGKVLDVVTSLPSPILMAALALHSLWLWGGLLVQWAKNFAVALLNVGIGLTKFVEMLPALAANPLVWVVAAAAGIAYLGWQMTQASSSAKNFINSLNQGLANDSASQAILAINTDIGKLNAQIQFMNSSGGINQIRAQWSNLGNTGQSLAADTRAVGNDWAQMVSRFTSGNFVGSLAAAGRAIEGVFVPGQGAAVVAKNNAEAYAGAIVHLTGEQDNLFKETGGLIKQGYSYSQALALMDMAGVKASDTFAVMQQKVANLITGYQNLGVQGGILGNAINAISFATEMQDSKIQQVTQAFTQFIGVVTGGQSAFISFAQQVQGTFQAAGGAANSLSMSNGKVSDSIKNLGGAAGPAAVSMNGLTSSSLNLRQSFIQSVTDGSNVINTLLTLSAASAQGAKGTAMVTQAGKDLVAQMLPLAAHSKDATTELYALAQTAGYQGADSFKALAQWVGNVKNPMQNLNSIESQLMGTSATLSKDVQSLAAAIGQNLNQAMAAAIFQARGGQTAFNNFANAALHAHGNTSGLTGAAQALASELITTMGNTSQAKAEFETFAGMLGIGKGKADALWASLNTLSGAEQNAANGARNVASAIASIPKYTTIQLHELITATQSGTTIGGISPGGLASPHAAGYRVPGYGGGDIVPALLEPGEAVVPKHLTSAVAPFLAAHGVPGFASGGPVASAQMVVNAALKKYNVAEANVDVLERLHQTAQVKVALKAAEHLLATDKAALSSAEAILAHDKAAAAASANASANTRNRSAAAAQDAAMLARWFPNAPIPAPAPLPPQFMGDWLPSALTGVSGGAHAAGGGGVPGGASILTAEHPAMIQVNLDGKAIWQDQQRLALRYQLRNNGVPTGLWKPR